MVLVTFSGRKICPLWLRPLLGLECAPWLWPGLCRFWLWDCSSSFLGKGLLVILAPERALAGLQHPAVHMHSCNMTSPCFLLSDRLSSVRWQLIIRFHRYFLRKFQSTLWWRKLCLGSNVLFLFCWFCLSKRCCRSISKSSYPPQLVKA